MNRLFKDEKGFTLVELLISITVLVIIIVAMAPLIEKSSRYFTDVTSRVKYQNAASNIISQIRGDAINTNYAKVADNDATNGTTGKYKVESDSAECNAEYFMDYSNPDFKKQGLYYCRAGKDAIPIVTNGDLGGRSLRVVFEVGKNVGGGDYLIDTADNGGASTNRLAMLYVYIMVYDNGADLSSYASYPDEPFYYTSPIDTSNTVDYDAATDTYKIKDTDLVVPVPVYYERTGIFLGNIRSNIEVPAGRSSKLCKSVVTSKDSNGDKIESISVNSNIDIIEYELVPVDEYNAMSISEKAALYTYNGSHYRVKTHNCTDPAIVQDFRHYVEANDKITYASLSDGMKVLKIKDAGGTVTLRYWRIYVDPTKLTDVFDDSYSSCDYRGTFFKFATLD